MLRPLVLSAITLTALFSLAPLMHSQARQPGAVYDFDRKDENPAPAPKHDISGIWEPAKGPGAAISGKGAPAMESCRRDKATGKFAVQANPPATDTGYATPDCLKPEIEPPYTPLGRQMLMAHKPTEGYRMVPPALTNDPVPICDPQGFPRIILHNFRTSEILQTPNQIVILYEFNKKWRIIWTDGRALPKDPEKPSWTSQDPPESRWWGYSVGRWIDDYTFVAESNGFDDDKTWLDNAGLPHSDALQVEETYRRVDAAHLEMSIKITDAKVYEKPWVALKGLPLRLQPVNFDIHEMECSPSETAEYNKAFSNPIVGTKDAK
jgi:hypothetical protein